MECEFLLRLNKQTVVLNGSALVLRSCIVKIILKGLALVLVDITISSVFSVRLNQVRIVILRIVTHTLILNLARTCSC